MRSIRPDRDRRQQILRAVRRTGLERPARRALELLEPARRRDRRDTDAFVRLLASVVPADGNCIDVGAHRGDLLAEMRRVAPDGRHVAVEPIPAFAAGLRADFPGVTVHDVALSDEEGVASFHVVDEEPAYSGLKERPYPGDYTPRTVEVRIARLDDLIDSEYVAAVVKIDVEGAELEVLKGGRQTLARVSHFIYLEHDPSATASYGSTSEDVHAFIVDDLGMRVFDLAGCGPYDASAFAAAHRSNTVNFVVHR